MATTEKQIYELRLTGVPQWANRRTRAGVEVTKTPSYHELTKAQLEAVNDDPYIKVKEVKEAPEGVNVSTVDSDEGSADEPDRLTQLSNLSRKKLEAVATEAGIENPGDKKQYPNIPTLAAAVVEAESPADEDDLETLQDQDEEESSQDQETADENENPDESEVSTADETAQEDELANADDAASENVQSDNSENTNQNR